MIIMLQEEHDPRPVETQCLSQIFYDFLEEKQTERYRIIWLQAASTKLKLQTVFFSSHEVKGNVEQIFS